METLLQDVRFAIRMLTKNRGFTLVAVATLALGIGMNTAVFSIVDAVMLRLPFDKPEQLMELENSYSESDVTPTSFPDFMEWRDQSHSFTHLIAFFRTSFNFTGGKEPERIRGSYFSRDYFALLGTQPLLGRTLLSEEHEKGGARVCLISSDFWRREFNSDPGVLGRPVTLDGATYSVVGVVPASPLELQLTRPSEVWIPLEAKPPYESHGTNYLQVIGRLNAGSTRASAASEIRVIQDRINAQFVPNKHDVVLQPLTDVLFGDTRPMLRILLVAVGLVLLIACANIANLLLARGTGRSKEFAVREALGASRGRVVRQLLTESLILAVVALATAALLTRGITQLFLKVWPEFLSTPQIVLDWRVAAFAAAISLAAVVLFGLAPALLASSTNVGLAMKEGSTQSTGTRSHGRLRSIFVAGEVTLALVLVIASVLTLRSFNRLLHTDLGFNPENLLTARIGLPDNRYSPEAGQRFFKELLSRLSNVHGVQSVAATAYVPLGDGGQTGDFQIEGRPSRQNQGPFAENHFVTNGYFQTLQIPLLRGRLFTDADRQGAPKVVVVNDYLARQIWPGQDAVGKRLGVLSAPNDWSEVVGVVADVKAQGVTTPPQMQIYLSAQQRPVNDMYVVIRAAADAGDILPALKHTVFEMDSQQPVSNVAFMDQLLSRSLSASRGSTFLLGLFATLAILLAGIGIYAVMAYSVSQRSREIGIRIALGASLWDIHGMVIGMCMRVCAWGLGAGLLAAFAVTRFLRNLLFGISTTDVTTFASSALLLAGAAVLASYIPARRAAKVDPMVALRYE